MPQNFIFLSFHNFASDLNGSALALLKLKTLFTVMKITLQIYEGLKAYRGADRKIRLFRPMENLKRFWNSARRMALPVSFFIL